MLTRMLPRMTVPLSPYRRRFGAEPRRDFAQEFGALERAGLVTSDEKHLQLTPRGMFFADSVAGLLAWRRSRKLRSDLPPNEAQRSMMG